VQSDAELVLDARAGDPTACASIYDRYADRIHDFCWSILRDRDAAADAMQDTFVLAARRLDHLRDPSKLRPWLFAIARYEAVRRSRGARPAAVAAAVGGDPDSAASPDDSGPEAVVSSVDAQEIVWAAVAGLSTRDQVLLDLHVRQGLDGHEFAEAVGMSPSQTYTLVNRLRDQVERSLGALLVARLGRDDCVELQRLLEPWDRRFTPAWRKRVQRHVDECDLCTERRRVLASPLALLAAVPVIPAPHALRNVTLDRIAPAGAAEVTGGGVVAIDPGPDGWPNPRLRGGFPPSLLPLHWARPAVAVAAAVVLALAVGGASYALFDDDESSTVIAATPATTAEEQDDVETTTTSSPASSAPDRSTTTTTRPREELRGQDASVESEVPAVVEPPPTTAPPPPPGDTTGPSISAGAQPSELFEQGRGCTATSAVVTATVLDEGGIAGPVTLRYVVGSQSSSKTMAKGAGDTYTATVGQFSEGTVTAATPVTVTVTARDSAGNEGQGGASLTLRPASECNPPQ
jgi:RNA polymerase sigma factor (sigma-70 family)